MATFDGKPTTKPMVVAWFTKETFARFKEIYADPSELPDTFEQWLRIAEANLERAKQAGAVPDKIILDPDAVLAWARANGLDVNHKTRQKFLATFIAPHEEG